jgi:hypothetical protein
MYVKYSTYPGVLMYDSIVADLNASRCTRLNVYNPCDTVNISRIAGQWERTSGLKFLYKEITCNTAVHKSNSELNPCSCYWDRKTSKIGTMI